MKTHTFFLLLSVFCFTTCNQKSPNTLNDNYLNLDKSIALKPPMGWNSWDCLGWRATEEEVKAAANYMSEHLKPLGYEYIVIDMLWYGDSAATDFEAFVQDTITKKPHYYMDEFGRLLPDPVKHPSSINGNGFKPLADYIHSLGLKFGVHLLRGLPWQAAEQNMQIKGTDISASTIAQPDKGCEWYYGFYGIDMSKPGAQEYYNSVFELFAEWGVDFVKADDVTESELIGMRKAIAHCERPIVFSVVPNEIEQSVLKENSHMARTGADFWDKWEMLKQAFPVAARVIQYTEPGYWPDLDMLPVGKLGKKISYKGPYERISDLTFDELKTLFSLWYISRNPLMIGGYLPETDSITYQFLTNKEALEVNRNSINNRQIKFRNAVVIWTADCPDSDDKYLAFFNQWESKDPINIKVSFSELDLENNSYLIRDLWEQKDLGVFTDHFSAPIRAHGAGLYKISNHR